MSQLSVFVFCAAIGFATAATLCNFYQLVTSEKADFSLAQRGVAGMAFAVVMSMFAGPFIVVQKVIAGLRSRKISILPAMIGGIVAGMWSVCAGIFYISLLISA